MLMKDFKIIVDEVCLNIRISGGWGNLRRSRCHKNSSCAIFVPKLFFWLQSIVN